MKKVELTKMLKEMEEFSKSKGRRESVYYWLGYVEAYLKHENLNIDTNDLGDITMWIIKHSDN